MLEWRGQIEPNFLVKHPGWQTPASGLRMRARRLLRGQVWMTFHDLHRRLHRFAEQRFGSEFIEHRLGVGPRNWFRNCPCIPPCKGIGDGGHVHQFHLQVLVVNVEPEMLDHQSGQER